MTGDFAPARGARVVAAVVLWIEATICAAGVALGLGGGVLADGDARASVIAPTAFAAIGAAALVALALAVARARRWATSPALTWQVLQGFVGVFMLTNGYALYGSIALALALVGGVALAIVARDDARASAPARD